MTVLC